MWHQVGLLFFNYHNDARLQPGSWFDVCWSFGVVGFEWYPCCRLKHSCALACKTDTTPTQPHRNSNTHRTKNNTTNVVIQQNSRKLLIMVILMFETCWAHKKWNKIASDIKLVHQVGILFLNYHNDARSNKHKIQHHLVRVANFWLRFEADFSWIQFQNINPSVPCLLTTMLIIAALYLLNFNSLCTGSAIFRWAL